MKLFNIRLGRGITTNEVLCSSCSVKKDVLKNFPNFTGQHLFQSFFLIKLQALRCFPVKFAKFLKNTYFEEHLPTAAAIICFHF